MISEQPGAPQTSETRTCDRDEGRCGELATNSYLWDWGEQGVCCAKHAVLMQQTSQQINRGVVLAPLQPAVIELTRDERVHFRAQILTLEEEIEVTKQRGLDLYRANEKLLGEVRLAERRAEEARVQLVEAEKRVERMNALLAERDAENATLLQEVERARLFQSLQPTQGQGGEQGHVVDG